VGIFAAQLNADVEADGSAGTLQLVFAEPAASKRELR